MDNNKTDLELMCTMLDRAKIGWALTHNDIIVLRVSEVYFIFDDDSNLVEVSDV